MTAMSVSVYKGMMCMRQMVWLENCCIVRSCM